MLLVLFIITLLYAIFYKTKRSLHMLQQNLYNENNRYVKWQIKNKKDFYALDIFLIIIGIIELIILNKYKILSNVGLIIISILQIAIGIKWHNVIKNNQDKKKLVITARVKRLIITTSILYLIPVLVIKNIWLFATIEIIMSYLNPLVVLIAMFINMPIEKLVYLFFKRKAVKKLKSLNNMEVVHQFHANAIYNSSSILNI